MKKSRLTALVCLVLSLVLLAGCGGLTLFSPKPDDSYPSTVAESRGEEGSRESWLASLSAPATEWRRAFEEAKADGSFTGTYLEFLSSVGADVDGTGVQTALRSVVSVFASFKATGRGENFVSAGSGVIYSLDKTEGDAFIVTNYHVVYSVKGGGISSDISLYLYGSEVDGMEIAATFYAGAMEHDIAVLRVEDSPFLKETQAHPVYAQELVAADSNGIAVGDRVYAVGNPEGDGISAIGGLVSVDAEYIDIYAADEKTVLNMLEIRTDAPVNHGNSGGGLFNENGFLIGIVNARSEEDGVQAMGYAIPANLALAVAQNLIDTRKANDEARYAVLARLGVTMQTQASTGIFDEETGRYYIEEKIVVSEVTYGGVAYRAGMKVSDTIISAQIERNGTKLRETYITRMHMMSDLMFEIRLGDKLTVVVSRDGAPVTLEIAYNETNMFEKIA